MDFYNRNTVGELTSRLSADIAQIQETLRTTVAEFFRQIVMIVGGVMYLTYVSWKLALIMLATVPVIAIVAVMAMMARLKPGPPDRVWDANRNGTRTSREYMARF